MSVATELEAIYDRHGVLTAEKVVAEAADPDHALHGSFEWDDTIAGHAYRCEQARAMIRSVPLRIVTEPARSKGDPIKVTVRAYHHVRGQYLTLERIEADPDLVAELLAQARRDAATFAAKYRHLDGFREIVEEMFNL